MRKKAVNSKGELRAGRVVVNLNREEFEFIDKIGRDALFTTGKRLTNNKILRTFVNVMRELKIDGKGLYNCNELKERLLVALGLRKERRMYPRFRNEVEVLWRKLDSMAKYEMRETTDVSQAGFRIELKEERKVGEILEFTIVDASMPDNPIKAFGRIAWVKRRGDNLEAGINLTYLPQKEKDRFNRLFEESKDTADSCQVIVRPNKEEDKYKQGELEQ